jgi:leucyl/phenylalanyl-tRNA---protein transferase
VKSARFLCFATQTQHDRLPDPTLALHEPEGLLAMGGDLSTESLLQAYHRGIFPWFDDDQPILWWSPNPRCVLFPDELHVSKSLHKSLRRNWHVTFNAAFNAVLQACAAPRSRATGTWITADMHRAYLALHHAGYAHSIESWYENQLVGGLYGVSLGKLFFGESMFSRRTDASKVAFVHLVRQLRTWGFELVDCQVYSAHLASLGARTIPRDAFLTEVNRLTALPGATWPRDLVPAPQ